MAIHDFNAQRLFVEAALSAGVAVRCPDDQSNYLRNVLRLGSGAEVLVFNGADGEWRARLALEGKRGAMLEPLEQVRPQEGGPDIQYLFAPLKRARLDYMVQKATELGVASLRPVLTRHTVAERVNLARMRSNAIEAAEQCGILRVPEVLAPDRLAAVLSRWDRSRPLVFCDEHAAVRSPITALGAIPPGPVGVLIGPEGGFAAEEREQLAAHPFTVQVSLGPRIMRADTAAVAALALVNSVLGDWRGG
ncbi:MAG: 16S rRNA (uracil(1498)-N(3))-methyltransferase [Hyphomicrobiaceae bacterium]|nr:16S rRNA (uracil(1498)-N(3))-methyltransferase [Hyphomicrobiaceae bacterium]